MDRQPPRSHLIPRTRPGRTAVTAFIALFALCMPPVTHVVLNRVQPTLLGLPFFWVSLLVVYALLIAVLIYAYRSGV
jgi:hypothetical protein